MIDRDSVLTRSLSVHLLCSVMYLGEPYNGTVLSVVFCQSKGGGKSPIEGEGGGKTHNFAVPESRWSSSTNGEEVVVPNR